MTRVFEQTVSTGNNFDGTAPSTTPAASASGGIEKRWPVDTHGGLFNFEERGAVWISVQLQLQGQTTWSLSLVDVVTGTITLVLWSGTNETSFATLEGDEVLMPPGFVLKFVTTGTTTAACVARVLARKAG